VEPKGSLLHSQVPVTCPKSLSPVPSPRHLSQIPVTCPKSPSPVPSPRHLSQVPVACPKSLSPIPSPCHLSLTLSNIDNANHENQNETDPTAYDGVATPTYIKIHSAVSHIQYTHSHSTLRVHSTYNTRALKPLRSHTHTWNADFSSTPSCLLSLSLLSKYCKHSSPKATCCRAILQRSSTPPQEGGGELNFDSSPHAPCAALFGVETHRAFTATLLLLFRESAQESKSQLFKIHTESIRWENKLFYRPNYWRKDKGADRSDKKMRKKA